VDDQMCIEHSRESYDIWDVTIYEEWRDHVIKEKAGEIMLYQMDPTETELINEKIAQQSNVTLEKIIQELIQNHDTREMREGVRYYNNENDIINRKRYYYKDGQKVEEDRKSTRLNSSHVKIS